MTPPPRRFPNRWKHVNKLRWVIMVLAFSPLIFLPYSTVYQHFLAAHAYDWLSPGDQRLYDIMYWLTGSFISDAKQFDVIKGTTWSATFWGFKISDPLAMFGQLSSRGQIFWPLVISAALPVALTVVFGRFFCGWLCPANLIYEITDKITDALRAAGLPLGDKTFDRRIKYVVLAVGVVASAWIGTVAMSAIYPPAIVGREAYYYIATSAIGAGSAFFAVTLLFDILVAKRGFCRVVCPGGALYSLLGRYRLLRVQRKVELCNDCTKCNKACMFDLNPMADGFGQECNNCAACIAVCPTGSLTFAITVHDAVPQGPGHLGAACKKARKVGEKANA
jgi:ferredoxin-type protein NapH